MVGKFINVRKGFSGYCFIDGMDGKSYFCHKNNLKDSRDWEFVWNGNECSFQIKENSDPGKKPLALNIIPLPNPNPNKEKSRREAIVAEKRREQKEYNRVKAENYKKRKDLWDSYCDERVYYIIMFKKRGSNDEYKMTTPQQAWKNKLLAEENLYFKKAENGDVFSYHIRKAIIHKVGNGYIVKELLPKNRVGKVLYQGGIKINA